MTSISSIETVTPQTSTSSPNTPSTSKSDHHQALLDNLNVGPANSKGKQREVDLGGYDELRGDERESFQSTDGSVYPPTNDEAAETRRIEENLRRWNTIERQRRKAERVSLPTSSSSTSSSLVENVSRKASLLWSGKRSRREGDGGLGKHVALQSRDNVNVVPLEDFDATPTPSPSPSPSPLESVSADPFASLPTEEPVSPFADPHQQSLVMNPSTDNPPVELHSSHHSPANLKRPALLAASSSSYTRAPPEPPRPLDLPPPRTPPPVNASIDVPPRPTSPPSTASASGERAHDGPKDHPWWHEWLCGCGEGPDRGGDYQAGRTNPFE